MSASSPLASTISPERDLLDHARVLLALVPAMLLTGITGTLADVPRILVVAEMGSDRYRIQWVTGATLLGGVLGMSIIGWLARHFGLRLCFRIGLLLYTIGGGSVSLAHGTDVLMIARFIQSWGIGMVVTTVLALLWREFPLHRDLGIVVLAFGIYYGRVAGPSVSTWLVNHDSWRSAYYFTTAAAAVLLLASWRALRPDAPRKEPLGRFDFLGLELLAGWVICLIVALDRFQLWGWQRANQTLVVMALGLSLFSAFIWQQFAVRRPLLALRLFGRHHFGLGVAIKALFDGQFFAVLAILTRYLLITRDYPRPTAGAVFLPALAAMFITVAITAHFGTHDNRKLRLLLGLFSMTAATWQLMRIDLFTEKEWVSVIVAVWAVGVGLVAAPMICIAEDNLQPDEIVSSSSIKNLGLVLPPAICVGLIDITTERAGDAYFDVLRQTIQPNRMPVGDVSAGLADWITSTHGSAMDVATVQASQVLGRYIRATASVYADQTAFGWLTLIGAAAFVLTLFLRKLPPEAPGPKRG